MGKSYETFEHTADMGLRATADTLGELYAALGEGLADVVCPRIQVRPREGRAIVVESPDRESLAVDFLSRLLTICTAERFCISQIQTTAASETRIQAILLGENRDPLRHRYGPEVKAVTYHMLHVAREGDQWTGQVLLDL